MPGNRDFRAFAAIGGVDGDRAAGANPRETTTGPAPGTRRPRPHGRARPRDRPALVQGRPARDRNWRRALAHGHDGLLCGGVGVLALDLLDESGRAIPLAGELREALDTLRFWAINTGTFRGDAFVCRFRKGSSDRATRADTVRKLFERWYRALGFHGCSSHSGRRTFATRGLRHLGKTGASSRDLQQLTGHKRLATLEGYVDGSRKAQRKLVEFA
jgi:hypothetical protein